MDLGRWCVNVVSSMVTNVPLWWEMLKIGEAMHVCERRVYWKSLYFSPDFSMNLKSSKKKVFIEKVNCKCEYFVCFSVTMKFYLCHRSVRGLICVHVFAYVPKYTHSTYPGKGTQILSDTDQLQESTWLIFRWRQREAMWFQVRTGIDL